MPGAEGMSRCTLTHGSSRILLSKMIGQPGGTCWGIVHFSGGLCILGSKYRNRGSGSAGDLRNSDCLADM